MARTSTKTELLRSLPSVDELLRREPFLRIVEREGRVPVVQAAREVIDAVRAEIRAGRLGRDELELALSGMDTAVERQLQRTFRESLRPVINATGVILHTNLGRAPLADSALMHAHGVSTAYSNLEFDLASGERGKRDVHVQSLLERFFASEVDAPVSTIVVNNNAAAVMLALNSLAEGGEVIVSRGELVEIGGSFRIPDVMSKSQAVLREVGTTNRTRIEDYRRAINDKTKVLLRVHRSNFQIVGFTEQPSLEDLVKLGREHNVPVLDDLGSGALFDLREIGVAGEPNVMESLRSGADVVTYSGDKMLGGPQCGLLSGRPEAIARCRSNPMFRALRVDKLIYAALESTISCYVKRDLDAIPAVRMMRLKREEITRRAGAVCEELKAAGRLTIQLCEGRSVIGGGAAPGSDLPTTLIAVTCEGLSASELEANLRANDPPIVARVEEGRVMLDLRTVFPEQEGTVVEALRRICS